MKVGKEQHEKIEKRLKEMGYEVEVPVQIEYKGYQVSGKIDALDRKHNIIYEIKSFNLSNKGFKQLMVYRDLLYLTQGKEFKVGFILYRGDRLEFVRNFLYLPPLLEAWKLVTLVVDAMIVEGELIRIECEDCKYCLLRDKCKPQYKYTRDGLKKVY